MNPKDRIAVIAAAMASAECGSDNMSTAIIYVEDAGPLAVAVDRSFATIALAHWPLGDLSFDPDLEGSQHVIQMPLADAEHLAQLLLSEIKKTRRPRS